MFITLFYGLVLINALFGKVDPQFLLRDANTGRVIGNISCISDTTEPLVGSKFSCKTHPSLTNISAKVFETTLNGTVANDFSDLIFIAPSDLQSLRFDISGYNKDGKPYNLTIANGFKFFTRDEINGQREKALVYLLALFGIISFSIPAAIANLRNLSNESTKTFIFLKLKK